MGSRVIEIQKINVWFHYRVHISFIFVQETFKSNIEFVIHIINGGFKKRDRQYMCRKIKQIYINPKLSRWGLTFHSISCPNCMQIQTINYKRSQFIVKSYVSMLVVLALKVVIIKRGHDLIHKDGLIYVKPPIIMGVILALKCFHLIITSSLNT